MEMTKLDAAMHQLDVAARLFLEGDYLASLTLAGAAEDMLGKEVERRGLPTALASVAAHHRGDTDPALTDAEHKRVIDDVANRARNSAKHFGNPNEAAVDVDLCHPLQMLMRAMPMSAALGLTLTPMLQELRAWIAAHPEATQ